MMDIRYREEYVIRSQEVDVAKRATPMAILQLMQEASMGSAQQLGVSVRELQPLNLAWVLLRKSVTISSAPLMGDKVTLITYPSHFDRFLAYRDYKMYDQSGELLAYASSTWTLMDMVKRKISRIPQSLLELKVSEDETLLERPPSKLTLSDAVINQEDVEVKLYDLDWNGHVNNLKFVRYILESLPVEYHSKTLVNLQFHIKAEAFLQDQISVQNATIEESKNHVSHRLTTDGGSKMIVLAQTQWK